MKSDSLCKKVSVSLPSNLHKWLIEESQKEGEIRGSRFTVSALIQEILNDWKKGNASADAGANVLRASESSASMSSTRMKKNSRRTG